MKSVYRVKINTTYGREPHVRHFTESRNVLTKGDCGDAIKAAVAALPDQVEVDFAGEPKPRVLRNLSYIVVEAVHVLDIDVEG